MRGLRPTGDCVRERQPHEGRERLRRRIIAACVVVLALVLAALGAALMLDEAANHCRQPSPVSQQRTYRASATVVPPHIDPVVGGCCATLSHGLAPDLVRSPQVVEGVVERANDRSITPAWLRRHSSASMRSFGFHSEVTLTVTGPRRAQVVRVANVYATVFAKVWPPRVARVDLRHWILSGGYQISVSCGMHNGKPCERLVSQRKILAYALRQASIVRPKDAFLVPRAPSSAAQSACS
jgi:hypothetical protein